MEELNDLRLELKQDFRDFLEQDFGTETGQGKYAHQIQDILKQYPITKKVRLEVDLQGEEEDVLLGHRILIFFCFELLFSILCVI